MSKFSWLLGKTAISAYGLIGLAIYQLTQKNWDGAWQSLAAAGGLLGIRHAIAKQ